MSRFRKSRGKGSALVARAILLSSSIALSIVFNFGLASTTGQTEMSSRRKLYETCDASLDWKTMATDPGLGMAAVFTPYDIVFGGGERYLLAVARSVQMEGYFVDVLVESQNSCNSTERLVEVAKGLRVELDPSRVALKIVAKDHAKRSLDVRRDLYSVFVSIGNEKAPLAKGVGFVNIYMCQFPFDLDRPSEDVDVESLASYDNVLVNSKFSATHYDFFASKILFRAVHDFGNAPQVDIVHPPVTSFGRGGTGYARKDIVLLGRFFGGRQSKGHAAAIETFRSIIGDLPNGTRLRFVGKLMKGHDEYIAHLKKKAVGLPISFEVDATSSEVKNALRSSLVQWHMTGGDGDTSRDPASEEHFGISVVEGQSTGVIPIVLDRGGLGDIVRSGKDGFLEKTPPDIGKRTVQIFKSPESAKKRISDEAVRGSDRFSDANFASKISRIVSRGGLTKPFRHLISETRREVYGRTFSLPTKRESTKALVIVEPRQHYAFEYVVKNALFHLRDWKLYVFHGIDNEDFVKKSLEGVRGVEFRRLNHHSITTSDLNKILLDPRFWSEVDAEKALLFQTDSLFLKGDISKFEKFDYAGAPWAKDNERSRLLGGLVPDGAGNGGLSLRSVKKMIDISSRLMTDPTGYEQEDLTYSIALGMDGKSTLPTRELARDFAVEVPIEEMEEDRVKMGVAGYPAAIHAAWYYWSYEEKKKNALIKMLELSICGTPLEDL